MKCIEKDKEFVVRSTYKEIVDYAKERQAHLPKNQKVALTNVRRGVKVGPDEYNQNLCSATLTIFMYV